MVLLAAAVADIARARGMAGAAVTGVSLAALAACVRLHAASALEGCGAPPATGAGEVGLLLAAHGSPEFRAVQRVVLEALGHHLQDAGGGMVTIADRVEALRLAKRRRRLEALDDAVGEGF